MAVRSSMASLIATTRQLIGDPAGVSQDLADPDIQDALDANRDEVRYELLRQMPDIQPGQGASTTAQFVWASYQSDFKYWESDVVIQGVDVATGKPWVLLAPVTFEYIPGKWTFAVTLPAIATPPGQWPPVWATGKVYDVYAAAAELLERRIALRSFTAVDFTADGRSIRLSQSLDRWEKLVASYRLRAWTRVVELERSDLAPDRGGNGVFPSYLSPSLRGGGEGGY